MLYFLDKNIKNLPHETGGWVVILDIKIVQKVIK
jgi:hypothetical protein